MTPEERDARTVFCMQLSARIRPRDLEEFFSSVGKVSPPESLHDRLLECLWRVCGEEGVETDLVFNAFAADGQT